MPHGTARSNMRKIPRPQAGNPFGSTFPWRPIPSPGRYFPFFIASRITASTSSVPSARGSALIVAMKESRLS